MYFAGFYYYEIKFSCLDCLSVFCCTGNNNYMKNVEQFFY